MTHTFVHILIFFCYIAAPILLFRALSQLLAIGRDTVVLGLGFFITCGITHMVLAVTGGNDSTFVTITDHMQAGFALVFLYCLIRDLRAAINVATLKAT